MKNQLYYGDNLEILRNFVANETVDLCYIDPPFNSDENYNQTYATKDRKDVAQAQAFIDTWTWGEAANLAFDEIRINKNQVYTPEIAALIIGLKQVLKESGFMAYLLAMTQRISEIYRVLKPTGSFYLHCDPTASHYLKLVVDAIFVLQGGVYLNEITWKRKTGRGETNHKSNKYGICTDIIFFYAKSKNNVFHSQFNFEAEGYQDYVNKFFKHKDEQGRIYRLADLSSPSFRPNLIYEYKGYKPPKNGWAVSREKMEQMDLEGRLAFPNSLHGRIQRKRFLEELKGKPVQNLWDDIRMISSQSAERLGYPTQKPEALLERIIRASSNEGDTVLDAFCGCGTTIAVAEKLGRNWIGIDITYQSISLILKRLEDSFGSDFTEDVIDQDKQIRVPAKVILQGEPQDFEAALALANRKDDRLRKEFEKWAILKFSKNRAFVNDKKGGDGGIDGIAYMHDHDENHKEINQKVLFSVKSGKNLSPSVVRDLVGTMKREKAELSYLISLYPVENLVQEARTFGTFTNGFGQTFQRITIVHIQEIFDGLRLNLPMVLDVVKSAELKKRNSTENLF